MSAGDLDTRLDSELLDALARSSAAVAGVNARLDALGGSMRDASVAFEATLLDTTRQFDADALALREHSERVAEKVQRAEAAMRQLVDLTRDAMARDARTWLWPVVDMAVVLVLLAVLATWAWRTQAKRVGRERGGGRHSAV